MIWIFGMGVLALVVIGLWADKRFGNYRDGDPRPPQDLPDTRPYFGDGSNTGPF